MVVCARWLLVAQLIALVNPSGGNYFVKQPRRPHFIRQWAEQKGMRQADLAERLNVDKGVVSRWYAGSTPGEPHQEKLAALFGVSPEAIFRDPDEDWFLEFFAGRDEDTIGRMKATLEAQFPKRTK